MYGRGPAMDTLDVVDFGFDPVLGAVWVELDAEPGLTWTYCLARGERALGRGPAFVLWGRHLWRQDTGLDEPDALATLLGLVVTANEDVEQMDLPGSGSRLARAVNVLRRGRR